MTPCDMGGAMLERFASVGVRWILCRSIGYDHVDLEKAKALGLRVSNVSYPPSGVANYAIMLMLMLQRRIVSILRRADLQDYSLRGKIGDDISFSTVGVIGTGQMQPSASTPPMFPLRSSTRSPTSSRCTPTRRKRIIIF